MQQIHPHRTKVQFLRRVVSVDVVYLSSAIDSSQYPENELGYLLCVAALEHRYARL